MALLFGRKTFRPSAAELPEALQELLGEVKEEKAELEVLLERVRNAAKSMSKVDKQVVDVSKRQEDLSTVLEALAGRAQSVGDLGDEVATARARVAELERGQTDAGSAIARVREDFASMAGEIDGLRSALKEARKLSADVEGMVGPS